MTTARTIIKKAMQKIGAITKGENPSADEANDAFDSLNALIASWSNFSDNIYVQTRETFSLTSSATYLIGTGQTFNTTRPIQIVNAFVTSGDIDYPLTQINQVTYESIPMKATTGIPEYFTYNHGVTSGATITKGTVFTVATVYDVHPITKQTLPTLKQFTVLADVTETSGNSVTISFSPAMYYTADGRQNISEAPADEDAIVFFGAASTAYAQNLGCHKEAFRLATVPLHLPKNQEFAAQETIDGITVSVVRGFDIRTREEILRFDLLAGLAPVRPEWAVRYTG